MNNLDEHSYHKIDYSKPEIILYANSYRDRLTKAFSNKRF